MLAARVKRFVFSSTAALFGNPERTPIEEDDPVHPTNAYGESKLLVERMLAWFHRIHGLRYASLRYFNAAGASRPDQGEAHQPETHLIPRILQVALGRAQHVNIFGTDYPTPDGTCIRDYIHVSDLARAHLLALEALEREKFQPADLQPRQWAGFQCARGGRSGAESHRASGAGDRIAAPCGRSSGVNCQLGENSARVGLAAEIPRFESHC